MLASRISAMKLLKGDWVLRSIYHPDITTVRLYSSQHYGNVDLYSE